MRSKVVSRFRCLEPSSMMKMFKEASKRSGLINLSLGEPDVPTDPGIVEALREVREQAQTGAEAARQVTRSSQTLAEGAARAEEQVKRFRTEAL